MFLYIAPNTPKTQRRSEDSQARSKPDPVDRVQTAHYIGVHMMCTIIMHNSTELVK